MRTLFLILFCSWSFVLSAASLDVYETIGGDFELNSTLSKKIGPQNFRGKVLLVFFGYTSCPDICPITLVTIKDALEDLEPDEVEKVQPLFISVDPERDTLEGMKQFLIFFHSSFVGLTATSYPQSLIGETSFTKVISDWVVSQLPSSKVALILKLEAVLSVHPQILLPPQIPAQSCRQSFEMSLSQLPQLSSVASPPITPAQSLDCSSSQLQ